MNWLWCQVCTFHCPLGKKRYIILPEGRDVHIQQHIHQKDLNLCLTSYDCGKIIDELEKHNKEFSCVKVFIMRSSSTLKFHFVFGFNEYLRADLRKFLVLQLLWVVVVYDFYDSFYDCCDYSTTQMTSSQLLLHADE